MKHFFCLLAVAALCAAPSPTFADSGDIAAAFAAATPTSYEGTATFRAVEDGYNGAGQQFTYEFTLNSKFQVIALVVNGTWVEIPVDQPLPSLPYPQSGTMRNVTVSIVGWDDYSSPLPSSVTGLSSTPPEEGRYAGSGYADVDWVNRDSSIWVTLSPAELVGFMPVDAVSGDPENWTLNVYGGSASSATWHDGRWGFWVRIDPAQSFYWYSLNGPNGSTWGSIDPANIAGSYVPGATLAVMPTGGVGIVDLRQKSWLGLTGTIDGHMDEPSSYPGDSQRPSHVAEAIALRAYSWQTVQISYAGPAAWILVQELDEYGQVVRKSDGTIVEWTFFPSQTYGTESSIRGSFNLSSGRARVIVTPTDDEARWGTYLMAVVTQGGRG